MDTVSLTASLGPSVDERATLSKHCQDTLGAVYRHPVADNLEWFDIIALLTKIGQVDHASGTEVAFELSGEHHRMHRVNGKDLTSEEVMDVRHVLSRAGWSPGAPVAAAPFGATGQVEQGQRASEDLTLYERVTRTLVSAGKVVVVGHGPGHNDAVHHLVEYLRLQHPEIYNEVLAEVVANLSSLTGPQRLDLASEAVSEATPN